MRHRILWHYFDFPRAAAEDNAFSFPKSLYCYFPKEATEGNALYFPVAFYYGKKGGLEDSRAM
jgi:hypothetical protein